MDQFSQVAKKYIDKGLIAGLEWEIRHFNKVVSKDVKGYSDVENKTILKVLWLSGLDNNTLEPIK